MSTPRKAYGLRVAALVVGLLLLSGVALHVLFGGFGGRSADSIFGNPFALSGGRNRAGDVRPELPPPPRGERTGTAQASPPETTETPALASSGQIAAEAPATPANRRIALAQGTGAELVRARRLAKTRDWPGAVAAYDRLWRAAPRDGALSVERARVLGWSGDHRGAALALEAPIERDPLDVQLRLEQARYFWWAGEIVRADSALGEVLRFSPGNPEADELRTQVRQGASPSTELASRWVRERPGALEHLLLARALARENRLGESLAPYRIALESGRFPDSLHLELASIAATADSAAATAEALERYLRSYPGERAARIRLARAYAWAGMSPQAIATYDGLLADAEDAALRFERAQLYAWSGDEARAEREALRVLELNGAHAPSLKLLGDLARWRGDSPRALGFYARAAALDASLAGAAEGAFAARQLGEAAPVGASADVRLLARWQSHLEAFGDSERFRWLSTEATRSWGSDHRSYALTVYQDLSDGAAAPRPGSPAASFGASVQARIGLRGGATAQASLGARGSDRDALEAMWGAEISTPNLGGASAKVSYQHQPATRRAATIAAREAGATSDLLQLTFARPLGGWSVWSTSELERFGSRFGSAHRVAGSVAFRRELSPELSASVGANALATDRASPQLAGWGPLFWSPVYYVSPHIGLAYQLRSEGGWTVGGRVTPGYAFVRERGDVERRFLAEHTPVALGGLDVGYARSRWEFAASGDWSGALDSGYHAAALRARFAFFPDRP